MIQWVLGTGIGAQAVQPLGSDRPAKRGRERNERGVAGQHDLGFGDLLGALAYAAPLLSTLLLVAVGLAQPSWTLAAACALIVGGAALARG